MAKLLPNMRHSESDLMVAIKNMIFQIVSWLKRCENPAREFQQENELFSVTGVDSAPHVV
jgi:hypothetical protein